MGLLPPALWDFARSLIEAGHFGERKAIVSALGDREGALLDLPAGTGIFSDLFDDNRYVGGDIDESLLRHARKKFPDKRFEKVDALKLPYEAASFENVLMVGFLHHLDIEDVDRSLDEVQRVLAPGGRFLLIEDHPTRDRWNLLGKLLQRLDAGGQIRLDDEYSKRLSARFTIEEQQPMRAGLWDYNVFVCRR